MTESFVFLFYAREESLDKYPRRKHIQPVAEVVELVDTLGSGSSGGFPVEVRVFSSAPFDFSRAAIFMVAALFAFMAFQPTSLLFLTALLFASPTK